MYAKIGDCYFKESHLRGVNFYIEKNVVVRGRVEKGTDVARCLQVLSKGLEVSFDVEDDNGRREMEKGQIMEMTVREKQIFERDWLDFFITLQGT